MVSKRVHRIRAQLAKMARKIDNGLGRILKLLLRIILLFCTHARDIAVAHCTSEGIAHVKLTVCFKFLTTVMRYEMISRYLLGLMTSVGVTQPDSVVTSVIGVSSTASQSWRHEVKNVNWIFANGTAKRGLSARDVGNQLRSLSYQIWQSGQKGHYTNVIIIHFASSLCIYNRSLQRWSSWRCRSGTLCLKKVPTLRVSVTLSHLNRFSKLLHCWKVYGICYETHMTLPTSP